MSNLIKSVNYDQHQIIRDILTLHNNGEVIDCDITYSKGNFYGTFTDENGCEYEIRQPQYKYDVIPQSEDVGKIEPLGRIPLKDGSIKCIVIDLPFVITSPTSPSLNNPNSSNIILRRFHYYGSQKELLESYKHWIEEAYRVLKDDGILIFKCQPIINSGTQIMTNIYSCNVAQKVGFYVRDEFILLAKSRLMGKIKKQQHARKYHSYFYVFKKNQRMRNKVLS